MCPRVVLKPLDSIDWAEGYCRQDPNLEASKASTRKAFPCRLGFNCTLHLRIGLNYLGLESKLDCSGRDHQH